MRIKTLKPIPNEYYEILDYPQEGKNSDIVIVSPEEAKAYYNACAECFKMADAAANYVVEKQLYSQLGIPPFMEECIRYTYDNADKHPHMLGRFDFAGGLDGSPIKLIEFNGDTPFLIFETAVVQYGLTKANGLDPDEYQFNTLFGALQEYFQYVASKYTNMSGVFGNIHEAEDDLTTALLMEAAQDSIKCAYSYYSDLCIDKFLGLCTVDNDNNINAVYNGLFKMVPWDAMINEDPDMLRELCSAFLKNKGSMLIGNPFYSVIYQSKYLLKLMCDMFPKSPYLLNADIEPLKCNYVAKPIWGREGRDISIMKGGAVTESSGQPNKNIPMIYQELVELDTDRLGRKYQAGVFTSMEEPCGLIFRRSSPGEYIINIDSDTCGHIIEA